MNIQPLFDRIVVKQQEAETMTASGIILADAEKERPQIATVVAVGAGGVVDGHEIVMQVSVGDKILYPKYAGNQFKLDGQEYIILRQSDVLAKLKD
ncbi:MAG: co-chaperone GroES [Clostridia bacterium]|nr:co-chaperone GroES [Clostridia bacterium]